jgi:hypothetical protein
MILLLFGVAIVMLAMPSLAAAFARYRMPAAPFLAMLAGIGYFGRYSHGDLTGKSIRDPNRLEN